MEKFFPDEERRKMRINILRKNVKVMLTLDLLKIVCGGFQIFHF